MLKKPLNHICKMSLTAFVLINILGEYGIYRYFDSLSVFAVVLLLLQWLWLYIITYEGQKIKTKESFYFSSIAT